MSLCEICSTPILGKYSNAKYCSKKCSAAAYRRDKKKRGALCSVDGCDNLEHHGGLCSSHHYRLDHFSSLDAPIAEVRTCTVEGCSDKHYGDGFCRRHYRQSRSKTGLKTGRRCKNCDAGIDHLRVDRETCSTSCHAQWHRRHGSYTEERRMEMRGSCVVPGCGRARADSMYCTRHRLRFFRNGDPLAVVYPLVTCASPGCTMQGHFRKGLCSKHYFVQYINEHREDIYVNHDCRRSRVRAQTPSWVDIPAIKAIYKACRRITRETGIVHHVDHVVPIAGRKVSGLHVHYNMQIIPATANRAKGNSFSG